MKNPTNYRTEVTINSEAGLVRGTITVPRAHELLSFLNQPEPFVNLSGVQMESRPGELPFLALHKRSMQMVMPCQPDDPRIVGREYTAQTRAYREVCLLADGEVEGEVEVLENTRVSDYLEHHPHFFPMQNCVTRRRTQSGLVEESVPLVYVNSATIVGVCDPVGGVRVAVPEPESDLVGLA